MIKGRYWQEVETYARAVVEGSIIANRDRVLACKRFLRMTEEGRYDVRP